MSEPAGQTFRASQNWLHTWSGVILGSLLFVIFWMGTLSVFDREIDKWMAPMLRLPSQKTPVSFDALRPTLAEAIAVRSPFWSVQLPTDREPTIRVSWRQSGERVLRHLDPATGAALPDPGTLAGTRFLYPFHYMLHIRIWQLGTWIVGLASMAMLALCISGVVIHRKIFMDFFTLRLRTKPRRLLLDLHNFAGVLGLPFHFMITLSGLIIFNTVYFPSIWQIPYHGDRAAFGREAFGLYERPPARLPGSLSSLDAMAANAQRLWGGVAPRSLTLRYPGDAAAFIQIARSNEDRVTAAPDIATFDGATGHLLNERKGAPLPTATQRLLSGFHLIQFQHWTLRWVYFGLGLLGCLLIATGYLFWLEARRRNHKRLGLRGVRIVEGLVVGTVTGVLVATLAFFVVNRLLPPGAALAGYSREAIEVCAFYLVWAGTFLHSWTRPRTAWAEQCATIAVLAVSAVGLNALTTGDHLVKSFANGHLWPIAFIDVSLMVGAAMFFFGARRLWKRLGT